MANCLGPSSGMLYRGAGGKHSLSIGYAVDIGLALTQVTKGRADQCFHLSMDGWTRVWLLLGLLRESGSPEVLRGQRWAGIYVTGAPAVTSWQALRQQEEEGR